MKSRVYTTSLSPDAFLKKFLAIGSWNTGGSALFFLYRRYYRCGIDKNGIYYIRQKWLRPWYSKKFRLENTDEHTIRVSGGISIIGIELILGIMLCIALSAVFFFQHFNGSAESTGEHLIGGLFGGIFALAFSAVCALCVIGIEIIPRKDVDIFLKNEFECVRIKRRDLTP